MPIVKALFPLALRRRPEVLDPLPEVVVCPDPDCVCPWECSPPALVVVIVTAFPCPCACADVPPLPPACAIPLVAFAPTAAGAIGPPPTPTVALVKFAPAIPAPDRRAISARTALSHWISSSSLGAESRNVRFVVTILNVCVSRAASFISSPCGGEIECPCVFAELLCGE